MHGKFNSCNVQSFEGILANFDNHNSLYIDTIHATFLFHYFRHNVVMITVTSDVVHVFSLHNT